MALAKIYPAKVLKAAGEKKGTTHYMEDPLEFWFPGPEYIRDHLNKEDVLDTVEDDEAAKYTEETGLPVYANETTAWLVKACVSLARGKATSAFKVNGTSPDTLSVEITGTLPSSMEDLLATERGGVFFAQKAAFLDAFEVWAKKGTTTPSLFVAALGRPSMSMTDRKAWPVIEKVVDAFVADLDDGGAAYAIYLRSLKNQLHAEEEVEDWSAADLRSL